MGSVRHVAVAAALAATLVPTPARSAFTTAPAPSSMSVTTATLAAPASASATNGTCVPALSRAVAVSWAVTASAFAEGYEVRRATSAAGPYATIATVTPRATVAYTDSSVAASTTYHYRIRSTKLSWRSGDSPTASVTTPSLVCL